MKLSTRADTEASIETTFAAFTDFERHEYRLQRKEIEITRDPTTEPVAIGCVWYSKAFWQGRTYTAQSELVTLERPQGLAIETICRGVNCLSVIDLLPLPEGGTRIFVSLDLSPTTLSSRLRVQALRLARGRLSAKLAARVGEFASEIGR